MNTHKTSLTKNEKEGIRKDISDKWWNREVLQNEYDVQIQKVDEEIQNLKQQKEWVTKESILNAFDEEIKWLEDNKNELETKRENLNVFIERKKKQILELGERANKQIETKEEVINGLEEKIWEIVREIEELTKQKEGITKENILKIFDEEIKKLDEEKEKLESEIGIAKNQDTFSVKLVKTLETNKDIQKLYNEDTTTTEQEKWEDKKQYSTKLQETQKEKTNVLKLNEEDIIAKTIMKKLGLKTLWKNTKENIFIGETKESDILLIDGNGEKIRTLEEKCKYPWKRFATDSFNKWTKLEEGMIPFMENGKYWFVDKYWKKMIDPEFSTIEEWFENWFCVVTKEDKEGREKKWIIDKTWKIIVPCKYDYIGEFNPKSWITRVAINKDNKTKYWIRCSNWKEVLLFDERLSFNEEWYSIVCTYDKDNKPKKWIINKEGNIVKEIEYDNIVRVSWEIRATEKNGKYGLLTNTWKVIFEPKYTNKIEYNSMLWNWLIVVEMNKKKWAIDTNGKEVVVCDYDDIQYSTSKKLFFLSKNGSTEIKDSKWKSLGTFNGNISAREKSDFYHETEKTDGTIWFTKIATWLLGKLWWYNVKSHIFSDMTDISYNNNNSSVIAKKYGKYGMMNLSTKTNIINFEYESIVYISETLFLMKKNGIRLLKNITNWEETFIDESIESCEYKSFGNKPWIIKATTKEWKIWFITLEGKMIQTPQFEEEEMDRERKILRVKKDGKRGLMNIKWEITVEPMFEELWSGAKTSYNIMWAKKDGKWGIIDEKWNWVVEPNFEEKIKITTSNGKESNTYQNYGNNFSSENKKYFMNGEEI